ncbi:WD40 repeat domain-containing protein [Lewinella cohaerens]|uniref:WD40 repeat domain-containing protein n=1 Tax=Lewinella cohaerens TaxID=70995 RepID=UPI00037870AF|nr:hypothetical protein [Lewinella cohaerens]
MSPLNIRKVHQLTGHNAAIYALVPGPQPGTFLSAAGDGWIVQWSLNDATEGEELLGKLVAKVDTQVFSLAYLPVTNTVVAGDMNGGVHWLNLSEDRPNRHLAHHRKGTYGIVIAGDQLITLGGDGVITRWDTLRQSSVESLQLSNKALRTAVYREEEAEWLIGASDHHIYRLDAADFSIKEKIAAAHENSVFCIQEHPKESNKFFSGSRDALLKVWQIGEEGAPTALLDSQPAHWYTINDLLTSPDGKHLLTASRDKTIRIWDTATYKLIKTLDAARDGGHVNSVNRLLWVPGTSCFVSASDDRSIIVWNVEVLHRNV